MIGCQNRVGGLGHVAIQYAAKFGFTVVAISRGPDKKQDCLELGVREARPEIGFSLLFGFSGLLLSCNS